MTEASRNKPKDEQTKSTSTLALSKSNKQNISVLESTFKNDSDLIIREVSTSLFKNDCSIVYIEGIADSHSVEEFIIKSLTVEKVSHDIQLEDILQIKKYISIGYIEILENIETVQARLLNGYTVLLVEGFDHCLGIDTKSFKERAIQESETEVLVRGPRDSFTEVIRTNTALIRQRIRSIHLRVISMEIGTTTNTEVSVVYLDHIAEQNLVDEVMRRLKKIDIDSILESGYIEELIQDKTLTPFPTILNTERPDKVAGKLLEGRIAILVNGTPFVLVVPALFIEFYQVPEDYYQRFDYISLLRILRLVALFLSLLAPSLYIAITTFHHEMLPPTLLVSLYSQREGVPFPAFVEAIIMEIAFEIIREAGLRMPRAVGQAVSIVGTLVVGLAAVEAGLVSAAMVIIVAITAISSFVIPTFSMSISFRMLRFPMMLLSATFGLYGIAVGCLIILLHLCSLRSFGIPYMSPIAPFNLQDQKDSILRLPIWMMNKRPKLLNHDNKMRTSSNSNTQKMDGNSNE
ncbi:spore germination protein [Bacillus sp. TS-2]|nr:spore germination protein [Bacillus sp. TS-2]